MNKLTATALTAAMVALLAAPAGSASAAASTCTITGFSPGTVDVGLKPVTVEFKVKASGCTVSGWDVNIPSMYEYMYDAAPHTTFIPDFLMNDEAGRTSVVVQVDDADYNSTERTFADGFRLTRHATWSTPTLSATKVKRGKAVTLKAKLSRADWDVMKYVGYGKRSVSVQFKAKGSSTWRTVRSFTGGSDAVASATVKPSSSGYWRLTYAGNSTSSPAVSGYRTVTVG